MADETRTLLNPMKSTSMTLSLKDKSEISISFSNTGVLIIGYRASIMHVQYLN